MGKGCVCVWGSVGGRECLRRHASAGASPWGSGGTQSWVSASPLERVLRLLGEQGFRSHRCRAPGARACCCRRCAVRRHRQCPEGLRRSCPGSCRRRCLWPSLSPQERGRNLFLPGPCASTSLRPEGPVGPVGCGTLRGVGASPCRSRRVHAVFSEARWPGSGMWGRSFGLDLVELQLVVLCPHVSFSFFATFFSPPLPLSVLLLF